MIQIQLKQHHTKGEIIKFACNNDPDKIRNIDVAIPLEWVNQNPDLAHFWYIMDYNKNPIFGEVKDLITLAEENGVKLILPPKTPDHEKGS